MVQVRAYRQEVKAWKAKVVRLCFSSSLPCILPPTTSLPQTSLSQQSDRDLLLSSSSSKPSHYGLNVTESDDEDAVSSTTAQQRNRLLQSTQTLSGSSARLENSHRLAAENEEIGQSVLSGLVGQRMQLQHANEQLEEADVSVGRAGQTITKMVRLCVALFSLSLVLAFGPVLTVSLSQCRPSEADALALRHRPRRSHRHHPLLQVPLNPHLPSFFSVGFSFSCCCPLSFPHRFVRGCSTTFRTTFSDATTRAARDA